MKYKDFSDAFLVAAYKESRLRPGETLRSGDIIDRHPIAFEPGWVVQLVRDLGTRGYFTSKGVDSDDRGQPIRLTGRGLRVAEDLIEKGVGIGRPDLGEGLEFPAAPATAVQRTGPVQDALKRAPPPPLILPSPLRPTPITPRFDWTKWGTILTGLGIIVTVLLWYFT